MLLHIVLEKLALGYGKALTNLEDYIFLVVVIGNAGWISCFWQSCSKK